MLEVAEIFNAKILIVDDQKANVILLEQMLKNAGYLRVSSTMDPRAVYPLHLAQCYDLILLDLQMPEMDGFQVMECLKEIDPDGYLPVLVITAQPSHKLRALQAGAKDFVSKPFDLIEVQTRIHNMLEVRLLYQKLENYNKVLEQTVLERTAELRESEARFKSFTELSSDWYWEQDAHGKFTKVSGPVFEMLGMERVDTSSGDPGTSDLVASAGWNAAERELLHANIAARRPFLDFVYTRSNLNGTTQYLQVSGEPMFDSSSRFTGYRGIGMELTDRRRPDTEQCRFRAAMGLIDQAVILFNRTGMRVIDANDTASRMTGLSRAELLASDLAHLGLGVGEELASHLDRLIAHSLTEAGEQPGNEAQSVQLRKKDAATRTVQISWNVLQDAGQWVVVGVISDTEA